MAQPMIPAPMMTASAVLLTMLAPDMPVWPELATRGAALTVPRQPHPHYRLDFAQEC
jgi:hypothetical protein